MYVASHSVQTAGLLDGFWCWCWSCSTAVADDGWEFSVCSEEIGCLDVHPIQDAGL